MNPLIVPHMQQQQPWNSAPTPSTSYVSISPKSAQQEQSLKAEDVWRARKKQKRNKPTLSCEECVERKTKVGARVLPSRQATRRRGFHCLKQTSLAKTRGHWEPFSQEIHLKFYNTISSGFSLGHLLFPCSCLSSRCNAFVSSQAGSGLRPTASHCSLFPETKCDDSVAAQKQC